MKTKLTTGTNMDLAGRFLYAYPRSDGSAGVFTPGAYEALVEMYARAEAGEEWDSILGSTPLPVAGVFYFCFDDQWDHLSHLAAGTISDLMEWGRRFHVLGGMIKPCEFDPNNMLFPQPLCARPDMEVRWAFDLPPDKLRARRPVKAEGRELQLAH